MAASRFLAATTLVRSALATARPSVSPLDRAKLNVGRSLHCTAPRPKKEEVTINIERNGQVMTLKGKEGDSILDVVVKNGAKLIGYGACEGTLSCSTCHVILSEEDFDAIPEKATDEELDMLDLAPGTCETSRLGCQIYLSKKIEGMTFKVPDVIQDLREVPGQSTVKS